MSGGLKRRLARLRELGLSKASELEAPSGTGERGAGNRRRSEAGPPGFLEGWRRIEDLVWERRVLFPDRLPDWIDGKAFRPLGRRAAIAAIGPDDSGRGHRIPAESLRFFDLETTGLSGGTGTIAFLAAVGRRADEGFEVEQFFLEDYPGEADFLRMLLARLEPDSTIATYNGAAFDMPLLRTRCVMNGIAAPVRTHLDALFACRRLWRRPKGGASLGLLEREVLGLEREEDVPGALIPEIWFEYLRSGDHPLMTAAMSHNAMDVSSLARLTGRAARIFAEPRSHAASSEIDRTGLGRGLLAAGRAEEGEELLEAALADGDGTAGFLLLRLYRAEGRGADRGRILDMLPSSERAFVERAKFHEHAMRDARTALFWARSAEELSEGGGEAIAARIARLERKIAVLGSR